MKNLSIINKLIIVLLSITLSGNIYATQNEVIEFNGINNEISVSTKSVKLNQDEIPIRTYDLLIEKEMNHYKFISYEKVINTETDELIYHKLILSSTSKIHVLYFDDNEQLIMERKWSKVPNATSI